MKWIALFSQTGSEIASLAEKLGKWPDVIITNAKNYDNIQPEVKPRITHTFGPDAAKTLYPLRRIAEKDDLITLHGWLRIVPPEICKRYNIYNGHPGWIVDYPELKGLNPQMKFKENINMYEKYGSVVHEVIEGVDEGNIVSAVCEKNNLTSTSSDIEVFEALRETSMKSWLDFFKRRHYY